MKHLKAGDSVVPFDVTDINGNVISPEDFRSKKFLISFYRYSECVFCNLQIHNINQKYDKWKRDGFEIIAVFQSPVKDVLEFVKKQNPAFYIISDPDRKLYQMYGIEEQSIVKLIIGSLSLKKMWSAIKKGFSIKVGAGNISLVPADFLVDDNQIIVEAYYGSDISDHISLQKIHNFIYN